METADKVRVFKRSSVKIGGKLLTCCFKARLVGPYLKVMFHNIDEKIN